MIFNHKHKIIRIIAAIVCMCFLWQDAVLASGGDLLRQRQFRIDGEIAAATGKPKNEAHSGEGIWAIFSDDIEEEDLYTEVVPPKDSKQAINSESVEELMNTILNDENSANSRKDAAEILGDLAVKEIPGAAENIDRLATNEDEAVRRLAIKAYLSAKNTVRLIKMLKDEEPLVRETTAMAFSELGDTSALRALQSAYKKEEDKGARSELFKSIMRLNTILSKPTSAKAIGSNIPKIMFEHVKEFSAVYDDLCFNKPNTPITRDSIAERMRVERQTVGTILRVYNSTIDEWRIQHRLLPVVYENLKGIRTTKGKELAAKGFVIHVNYILEYSGLTLEHLKESDLDLDPEIKNKLIGPGKIFENWDMAKQYVFINTKQAVKPDTQQSQEDSLPAKIEPALAKIKDAYKPAKQPREKHSISDIDRARSQRTKKSAADIIDIFARSNEKQREEILELLRQRNSPEAVTALYWILIEQDRKADIDYYLAQRAIENLGEMAKSGLGIAIKHLADIRCQTDSINDGYRYQAIKALANSKKDIAFAHIRSALEGPLRDPDWTVRNLAADVLNKDEERVSETIEPIPDISEPEPPIGRSPIEELPLLDDDASFAGASGTELLRFSFTHQMKNDEWAGKIKDIKDSIAGSGIALENIDLAFGGIEYICGELVGSLFDHAKDKGTVDIRLIASDAREGSAKIWLEIEYHDNLAKPFGKSVVMAIEEEETTTIDEGKRGWGFSIILSIIKQLSGKFFVTANEETTTGQIEGVHYYCYPHPDNQAEYKTGFERLNSVKETVMQCEIPLGRITAQQLESLKFNTFRLADNNAGIYEYEIKERRRMIEQANARATGMTIKRQYLKADRDDRSDTEIRYDLSAQDVFAILRSIKESNAIDRINDFIVELEKDPDIKVRYLSWTKKGLAARSEFLRQRIRSYSNGFMSANEHLEQAIRNKGHLEIKNALQELNNLNKEVAIYIKRRILVQLMMAQVQLKEKDYSARTTQILKGIRNSYKALAWKYGWRRRAEAIYIYIRNDDVKNGCARIKTVIDNKDYNSAYLEAERLRKTHFETEIAEFGYTFYRNRILAITFALEMLSAQERHNAKGELVRVLSNLQKNEKERFRHEERQVKLERVKGAMHNELASILNIKANLRQFLPKRWHMAIEGSTLKLITGIADELIDRAQQYNMRWSSPSMTIGETAKAAGAITLTKLRELEIYDECIRKDTRRIRQIIGRRFMRERLLAGVRENLRKRLSEYGYARKTDLYACISAADRILKTWHNLKRYEIKSLNSLKGIAARTRSRIQKIEDALEEYSIAEKTGYEPQHLRLYIFEVMLRLEKTIEETSELQYNLRQRLEEIAFDMRGWQKAGTDFPQGKFLSYTRTLEAISKNKGAGNITSTRLLGLSERLDEIIKAYEVIIAIESLELSDAQVFNAPDEAAIALSTGL